MGLLYRELTKQELEEAKRNICRILLINRLTKEFVCIFYDVKLFEKSKEKLKDKGNRVIVDTVIGNCHSQVYYETMQDYKDNKPTFLYLLEQVEE